MKELYVEKKRIHSAKDFAEVKSIWTQLETGDDMTAFQQFEWNVLLAEEFFADTYNQLFSQLYVYSVQENEKPVLIVPFIIQKCTAKFSWWGRKKGIYFLGINSYSDYMNFVYRSFNPDALELLITALKKDFPQLPVYLDFIRNDTATYAYFIERRAKVVRQTTSAYVEILEDSNRYLSSLSKSTKQNLRTAKNRIDRDELNYTVEITGVIEDDQTIDFLTEMHTDRSRSKNSKRDVDFLHLVSRILMTRYREHKEKKYDIIQNSMKRLENSYVVTVRLNNKVVSYLYGLVDSKAYRVMQNCFDEDYKFYSPMFRGAFDLIAKECDEKIWGVSQIDFTRGNEEYKLKLGGQKLPLFHFVLD